MNIRSGTSWAMSESVRAVFISQTTSYAANIRDHPFTSEVPNNHSKLISLSWFLLSSLPIWKKSLRSPDAPLGHEAQS
ncbi:hypothetical protein F383_11968 [Gossypium arboreum]|uniref:Uncharacterized protein n=1 Tax=Gossypium arboreum TaxID=29729 RepID=A0A0B0MQE6_GOSAR|nr:hypothetical protein F383_22017 [Gossypium arboreum]KHG29575.1 hypothetical protein F383_11968 [Gossypium arboreum]